MAWAAAVVVVAVAVAVDGTCGETVAPWALAPVPVP